MRQHQAAEHAGAEIALRGSFQLAAALVQATKLAVGTREIGVPDGLLWIPVDGQRKKTVRTKDVEHIVATMAKIPPRSVSVSDREHLETLERDLKLSVFSQDEALRTLASAIKLARAGLGHPGERRPA